MKAKIYSMKAVKKVQKKIKKIKLLFIFQKDCTQFMKFLLSNLIKHMNKPEFINFLTKLLKVHGLSIQLIWLLL